MKLTNNQQQEIEYIKSWNKSGKEITESDIEDYINATVHGIGKGGKMSTNPLVTAKQRLEITLALWKEDLTLGLVSVDELLEEATCEFEKNLIVAIRDSVSRKYRIEVIEKNTQTIKVNGKERKIYPNIYPLGWTNFPKLMKEMEKIIK